MMAWANLQREILEEFADSRVDHFAGALACGLTIHALPDENRRDVCRAAQQRYCARHPDSVREIQRRYRANHREATREKQREYRARQKARRVA